MELVPSKMVEAGREIGGEQLVAGRVQLQIRRTAGPRVQERVRAHGEVAVCCREQIPLRIHRKILR